MAKKYTVVHKKSNVVSGGVPKLPFANTLQYGEIAINYGAGGETLSIRNSNDQIATFPSRTVIEGIISEETQNFITGYTETDPTVPAWAKEDSKPSYTASEVGAMATSERGNYLTTATTIPNVDNYFDDVEYDSGTKRINFKHGETVKDYIDATGFIKDGMVDVVEISTPTGGTNSGVTCLVVTFNTDAGKEDIEIPLSQIFNASNYYNKAEADEKFLAISSYTEDEAAITTALDDLDERIDNLSPEVIGAMATSERSNYLTTATTIPTEASIEASGFTKNALTGYTETDPTVPAWAKAANKPSYTAAEVGAMATSERNNYSTTGHTHGQYSLTSHTHTAAEVGAMATSERNNYSTTAHTHSQYLTTATTIPTESTISASGFTKNAITGINVNGNPATVANGVAEITVQSGGSTLPSVTAADNGKVLMVVNGTWAVVMPTTVYTGTDTPLSSIGNDGDIYLQTS